MQIPEHAVLVVGAGPAGLMLAGELALAGVDVGIVERRKNQELAGSRAGGLHPRTLEVLDQRGIVSRFVSQGQKHHVALFAGALLDTSDLPSRHNYWLGVWQTQIEKGLADWVSELAVPIYRDCEFADFSQDGDGVCIELNDGRTARAGYLVGCDGGRSLVRRKAQIDFPGWEPSISYLIFEAEMVDEPAWGIRHGEKGIYALGKLEGDKAVRGVVTEQSLERGAEPTLDELREALIAAYGADYGIRNVTWLSRFTDAARQAASYRSGRVLLVGDAAHIHSPAGGQGLNLGVQDAVNFGWKLAQVVKGISSENLLDTYQAERHPIGLRVLKYTMGITALNRGDDRMTALREMMTGVMQMEEPRKWHTAMISGLDVRYDFGEGHPLLGRRTPDLDLITDAGTVRLFSFMHDARPIMLSLNPASGIDITLWADRVKSIEAGFEGKLQLPAVGAVSTPNAILVRPDGHVAWVDGGGTTLAGALRTWFGPPASR